MSQAVKGMIIFDLDGTLTVPTLDFDAIRAEIGLPPGPILEALQLLSEADRHGALMVLNRHEQAAAQGSQLRPGAQETVRTLRAAGWPVAVLTRNARRWVELVLQKHNVAVDAVHTRDDGVVKPSPDPVLRLCAQTRREPSASWMIGDHLFDLVSGRAAGCTTVLLVATEARPQYADQADHVITHLSQLLDLVRSGGPSGR